jgi:nicotinamidase/pyrazinamidase
MKRALVLVDLQNDFMPGGALPVPAGDEVVPIANALARGGFDLVVATQDWHPPDHASFAANHPGRRPGEIVELDGTPQVLWPVHCVQDTRGAEFVAGLDTRPIERVFFKGAERDVDSYSTFFDNLRRRSTGLDDYLRERGVGAVYLAGVATDYCVRASALDARRLGFPTFVVLDACRGIDLMPGDIDRAVRAMTEAGVRIVTYRDAIATPAE